jgi:hypothetical protein
MAIERVRVFAHGLFRQAETDHVRNDDPVTRTNQGFDELSIQESPGWIAVKQDHRVTRTFIHIMHAPSVNARVVRGERPLFADVGRKLWRQHVN